jgi:hypothetical protein
VSAAFLPLPPQPLLAATGSGGGASSALFFALPHCALGPGRYPLMLQTTSAASNGMRSVLAAAAASAPPAAAAAAGSAAGSAAPVPFWLQQRGRPDGGLAAAAHAHPLWRAGAAGAAGGREQERARPERQKAGFGTPPSTCAPRGAQRRAPAGAEVWHARHQRSARGQPPSLSGLSASGRQMGEGRGNGQTAFLAVARQTSPSKRTSRA